LHQDETGLRVSGKTRVMCLWPRRASSPTLVPIVIVVAVQWRRSASAGPSVAFSGEYDLIIAAGWQANPDLAQPEGKRSRKQHPARDRLASVAGGQVASACPPATNFAVPFDTNQAERDLCMLQVQQKVAGGWRTELGFQILCRLRSDLSTLHKQGMDLLHALQQTFLGHPVFPTLETPC
jgi:transposase